MATLGKRAGLTVIAICSLSYASATEPVAEVGRRLPDVADLTLDNLGETGDAVVALTTAAACAADRPRPSWAQPC